MGISFSVHPLFFACGLYFSLTGKITTFIIYTLCAILHELGHSIMASKMGYKLKKIKLMPFGAIVSGQAQNVENLQEIKIALAGPITNILVSVFFVALWWVVPELYAFTDIVVEANLSLAIINLLPIFPLDGGRVLLSTLSTFLTRKKSLTICKVIAFIFCFILLLLFFLSIFYTINLSLIFFALFIIFANVSKDNQNVYIRLYLFNIKEKLKKGVVVKKIAVDKEILIKNLLPLLEEEYLIEVAVYDKDKQITVLSQQKLIKLLESATLKSPLKLYI